MHNEITRRLYDAFPLERKSDFWAGYLYLKYTEHFFNKTLEAAGLQSKELPPLDPAVEEMIEALAWQVADSAESAETSLYHGKIVIHEDALKLFTQKEDLNITPPERVLPFKIARDIVLENPGSIAAGTCPCRSVSPNPCLPPGEQDVCLFIGDPWVTFMDEHNATYHRISQDEAFTNSSSVTRRALCIQPTLSTRSATGLMLSAIAATAAVWASGCGT